MRLSRTNNSGFTLLELLVFIAIAGLIIPAVLLAFRQSVMELDNPVIETRISGLAREKMEEFLQYDYDDPSLPFGLGADAVNLGGGSYNRLWVVLPAQPVPGFPFTFIDTGYKRLLVAVRSPDLSRTVILENLMVRK